jgi:hypothetical protein
MLIFHGDLVEAADGVHGKHSSLDGIGEWFGSKASRVNESAMRRVIQNRRQTMAQNETEHRQSIGQARRTCFFEPKS